MFDEARIKLTGWYLLIIMTISLLFTGVIYRMLTLEVDRFSRMNQIRMQRSIDDMYFQAPVRNNPLSSLDEELVLETKRRIKFVLIYVNGVILVLSGGLGYFLAGRTLQPIKEMVDEQNRFIADASHELRTPLTAMKSALEVNLRDKQLSLREAKTLLKENITDVDRLKALTDALLRLTALEHTEKRVKEQVKFNEVITSAIRNLRTMARKRQLEIKVKTDACTVEGSGQSLSELVSILVDNAIKYSDKKSTIFIRLRRKGNWAVFSVRDQGKGIKKEDLPHIFDRFYRAEGARQEGGYGLGLSIAKRIVENHKGNISAESEEGEGAVFTVRIPLKKIS